MSSPEDNATPFNTHFLLDPPREHQAPSPGPASSDGDTASQRSIALSSPVHSARSSIALSHSAEEAEVDEPELPEVTPVTLVRQSLFSLSGQEVPDTDASSDLDVDGDEGSFFAARSSGSPISSAAPSIDLHETELVKKPMEETPVMPSVAGYTFSEPIPAASSRPTSTKVRAHSDGQSVTSFRSEASYTKKARPESLIVQAPAGQLILGIALVDFDHLVGPKIEFCRGDVFEDEEIVKILPFLALPDGAHLTTEDYSYFHLVPTSPTPSTIFGISCNRQISASELLVKDADVTRSTVQKAVVVLASKPIFGLVRDRLGVITRALFAQRDFTDMSILDDFHSSLENSVRSQLTESGLYMGSRELVHNFRQRTLVILKALLLQKKIMFFGHPVERLCTYQYSLVTLIPGLLQHLDDCGSPPLATRAKALSQPTSLRTSDHKSVMAYIGLPLDLFGKDAFFQPYLPLQQLDMLKDTGSWLCGSTNTIVTQQKEVDLLVNIETGIVEFRDPTLERIAGLTPADRKWMDDIMRDVNETYNTDPTQPLGMRFKGSDDYLRQKFEEYISGALASVKYTAFLAKGQGGGVVITDGSGDPRSVQDFNAIWIQEFKKTNAYEVWDRVTDPLLFDIVEARHPCNEKPSVVADIGLRLSEGIQELKLDQQLAPTREAISRTFNAGSTSFFKAVEGVRGRWLQRNPGSDNESIPATSPPADGSTTSTTSSMVEVNKEDADMSRSSSSAGSAGRRGSQAGSVRSQSSGLRPLSIIANQPPPILETPKSSGLGWSAGISSFFSQRASRLSTTSLRPQSTSSTSPSRGTSPQPSTPPPNAAKELVTPAPKPEVAEPMVLPSTNLDEVHEHGHTDDDAYEDHDPAGTGVAL
ncbi:hypothetical protein CERSUDRAFT_63615 [Gelatoporia subvermispora B]|uniref:UDENN domain-containing protein n=1 Tax=Ceriporiopsis subvermispora (strain B) TaxID=914234 RepID=M2RMP9_CERS8|nr:hypothetical protein CERSUDRAFT_63615 [Gelatoporia subvermispora B]